MFRNRVRVRVRDRVRLRLRVRVRVSVRVRVLLSHRLHTSGLSKYFHKSLKLVSNKVFPLPTHLLSSLTLPCRPPHFEQKTSRTPSPAPSLAFPFLPDLFFCLFCPGLPLPSPLLSGPSPCFLIGFGLGLGLDLGLGLGLYFLNDVTLETCRSTFTSLSSWARIIFFSYLLTLFPLCPHLAAHHTLNKKLPGHSHQHLLLPFLLS